MERPRGRKRAPESRTQKNTKCHFAFEAFYNSMEDPSVSSVRKEGKELDELTSALKEPVESKEIRFKITEKDFRACGEKIIADLTEYAEKQDDWQVADDNREGIRASFGKENGDGWFLLRLSVHDPIMPLNIESDSKGGVDLIYNQLFEFLKTTDGLEI